MYHGKAYDDGTTHEHEWRTFDTEREGILLYVYEECQFAEITGTYTDYARDEVYTETGYECDETRAHSYRITAIGDIPIPPNGDGVTEEMMDMFHDAFAEKVARDPDEEYTDEKTVAVYNEDEDETVFVTYTKV
jgi:hypothetical protein